MSKQQASSSSNTPSSDKKNSSKDTAGAVSMNINDSQFLDKESPASQGIKTPTSSKAQQDGQATSAKSTLPSTPIRYNTLFTTRDEHIVSNILRQSNFTSESIKFLMMESKLRTFPQVANMTQEDWNNLIQENNINLKSTDFMQIVVFQTWWNSTKLNCEIEDIYKTYTLTVYDGMVNENFQLESSPSKSDQPPKTVSSDSSRDSFKTSFQKVTPPHPLTKWEDASVKSHKSTDTSQNFENNHFVQFMDNEIDAIDDAPLKDKEDHDDAPLKDSSAHSLPTEIRTPTIKNDEWRIPSYKQALLKSDNLLDEVQSSPGRLFKRAPTLRPFATIDKHGIPYADHVPKVEYFKTCEDDDDISYSSHEGRNSKKNETKNEPNSDTEKKDPIEDELKPKKEQRERVYEEHSEASDSSLSDDSSYSSSSSSSESSSDSSSSSSSSPSSSSSSSSDKSRHKKNKKRHRKKREKKRKKKYGLTKNNLYNSGTEGAPGGSGGSGGSTSSNSKKKKKSKRKKASKSKYSKYRSYSKRNPTMFDDIKFPKHPVTPVSLDKFTLLFRLKMQHTGCDRYIRENIKKRSKRPSRLDRKSYRK